MKVTGISIGEEVISPSSSNFKVSYGDAKKSAIELVITLNGETVMNTFLEKIISTIEKRDHWTTADLVSEIRGEHTIHTLAARHAPESEVLSPGEHPSPPDLRAGFRPEDD